MTDHTEVSVIHPAENHSLGLTVFGLAQALDEDTNFRGFSGNSHLSSKLVDEIYRFRFLQNKRQTMRGEKGETEGERGRGKRQRRSKETD